MNTSHLHHAFLLFLIMPLLSGCTYNKDHRLITPDNVMTDITWTKQELSQNISVRNLFRTQYSSLHIVHIRGKEQPHYHDRHDLFVTQLTGTSRIHFKSNSIEVFPGDTVFIPSGTYHWAENLTQSASVIAAHFSPAFDGKDKRIHSDKPLTRD